MSGANLGDLGASLSACTQALEAAQSALNLARDRADSAQVMIAQTADGSNNDLLASVMALIAQTDVEIEGLLGNYVACIDSLSQYRQQKGLAG